MLRYSAVEVSMAYAARASRAGGAREADALAEEGLAAMQALYQKARAQ